DSRTGRPGRRSASSRRRPPDRRASSPHDRDRSAGGSLPAPAAGPPPCGIETRQNAPQNVDLGLVELGALEDAPQLQLELTRMRFMDEAGLDEDALEVLVEMLELGGRRKTRPAGPGRRRRYRTGFGRRRVRRARVRTPLGRVDQARADQA